MICSERKKHVKNETWSNIRIHSHVTFKIYVSIGKYRLLALYSVHTPQLELTASIYFWCTEIPFGVCVCPFFCVERKSNKKVYNPTTFFLLSLSVCRCESSDLIGASHCHWLDFNHLTYTHAHAHAHNGFPAGHAIQKRAELHPVFCCFFSLKIIVRLILYHWWCVMWTCLRAYALPNLHHVRFTWATNIDILSLFFFALSPVLIILSRFDLFLLPFLRSLFLIESTPGFLYPILFTPTTRSLDGTIDGQNR